MVRNDIYIHQNIVVQDDGYVRNEYHFGDDWDNYLGGLLFPNDGRYSDDEQALDDITHVLAVRWGFVRSAKKHERHNPAKAGIMVKQVENIFHFASVRGHYLGCLAFPADNQHLENMLTLEQITYTLGVRWGLIRTQRKQTGKAGK